MNHLTPGFAAVRSELLRDAYPADIEFPRLEIASDPARMLEILRAHLKPRPGRNTRILTPGLARVIELQRAREREIGGEQG